MYEDEEEELELLRQYEAKDYDDSEDNAHSSDEIDSDLEDKIMSMVQYGSGLTKKKAPLRPSTPEPKVQEEPEIVHAPISKTTTAKKEDFSFSNELQLHDSEEESNNNDNNAFVVHDSDEEHMSDVETSENVVSSTTIENVDNGVTEAPQITNFIDLNDQPQTESMDEDGSSEEEEENNSKLQQLIEAQINLRQSLTRKRFGNQTVNVCFSCHQPGHERRDCVLCMECGGPKHVDNRCTGLRYCMRCKHRGHNRNDCDNDPTYGNCRLCNISYHHWSCCPSMLHVYVNEAPAKTTPVAFCYNCTDKGHYGDECPYLPQYLSESPSAFSKYSLDRGSRFDPRKFTRESSSSRPAPSSHQRFSDSSRESSPQYDNSNRKNNNRSRFNNSNEDSDDSYSHKKKRRRNNSNNSNNSGNDSYKYKYTSSLDQYFEKGNKPQRSGNSNWKALNNNSLPQPTRSGTVNMRNNNNNNRQQNQGYEPNFPRSDIPQPSSSGVIDLTGGSSKRGGRAPKYHGGYKRN